MRYEVLFDDAVYGRHNFVIQATSEEDAIEKIESEYDIEVLYYVIADEED